MMKESLAHYFDYFSASKSLHISWQMYMYTKCSLLFLNRLQLLVLIPNIIIAISLPPIFSYSCTRSVSIWTFSKVLFLLDLIANQKVLLINQNLCSAALFAFHFTSKILRQISTERPVTKNLIRYILCPFSSQFWSIWVNSHKQAA